MPELPEVETTRRGIEPHVAGRVVTHVLVREPRLRWPVSPDLGQALTGQRIRQVARRAKYLLMRTNAGTLMMHLGMSGSLRVLAAGTVAGPHDHVDIGLDDGQVLRFRDPRRFGSMFWLAGSERHELLSGLGPEPLEDAFCVEHLFAMSRGRSIPIKNFIMNSRVVVGIGNIYANEALYMARIRPDRAAGSVSRARYHRLVASIKLVLASAIDAGGTTLRDFVREDGSPGYFRHDLQVYGRAGEPCPSCGRRLREVRLGQRATVFCGRCQR